MSDDFYWRHARDSLLTESALQLFQILASKEGEQFNDVKNAIDEEYFIATGRDPKENKRHGGKIQTALAVYREAGWVLLDSENELTEVIKITDAGKQALQLLCTLPDFCKAVPYFVTQILSRYQLNNPAKPKQTRDSDYDEKVANSDIFPYWTLFKIIRSTDNQLSSEELRRFVFRLQSSDDIDGAIKSIRDFRKDVDNGAEQSQLDSKYAKPLEGAIGEPKYLLGRLGTQVGNLPPVIQKKGAQVYELNPAYESYIDSLISKPPQYKEYLTEKAWMSIHGESVTLDEKEALLREVEKIEDELPADDELWIEFKELVEEGNLAILLSGPPGTSKTWYAFRLANKLVGGEQSKIRNIQFHPSYSYEDFIEGYVPTSSNDSSSPAFEVRSKLFLKLCEEAQKNPKDQYVLIIEELSRADPSRVFGELLTYIEPGYRNKAFYLPYSGRKEFIPNNILVLATMNPYDKSVIDLDDAMDRRFAKIPMEPNAKILRKHLIENGVKGNLVGKVMLFFEKANELSPHGLGHAVFMGIKDTKSMRSLWRYKLKSTFERMFPFDPSKIEELQRQFDDIQLELQAQASNLEPESVETSSPEVSNGKNG